MLVTDPENFTRETASAVPQPTPRPTVSSVPYPPSAEKQDPLIRDPVKNSEWISPVWPHGTEVVRDGDRYGIRLPYGKTVWVGDTIHGGGGTFFPPDPNETYGLSPTCLGSSLSKVTPGSVAGYRTPRGALRP